MTQSPQPVVTTPSKTLRWALVVSLALNLGVGGMMLGAVIKGGPGGHDMVRDMGFGPYDAALRPQDRDTLRAAMRQRSGDLKANLAMGAADLLAVVTSLRATPFDPAALGAAMTRQQDHLSTRMQLGTQAMQDFLISLTAQERLDFADRLEDRLRRGPKDTAGPRKY